MPVFEYRARDEEGKTISGTLFGSSLEAAASNLAGRGLVVEHLGVIEMLGDPVVADAPKQGAAYATPPRSLGEGSTESPPKREASRGVLADALDAAIPVPLSQVLFFFRQLATMLSAGVGMVQSLDTLSTQTQDRRLKSAIEEIREHVRAGASLSFGMSRHPEIFTPVMLNLLRAGEESGRIDEALRSMAKYVEQEIHLRAIYSRVTFYPKLTLVSAALIIVVTNAIVGALGGPFSLPNTFLRLMLGLAPIVLLMMLFFRVGIKKPSLRRGFDQAVQYVPVFGKTVHQLAMAKFGRVLGALYAGGVPLPRAMQLAADACGNEYLREKMLPAAKEIEEGGSIAAAMAKTGAFTPVVLDMVSTGESTGNLDTLLSKLSEYYEDEAETRAIQSGYVVGVVVFLIVAVVIFVTIILPFYMQYAGAISSAGA